MHLAGAKVLHTTSSVVCRREAPALSHTVPPWLGRVPRTLTQTDDLSRVCPDARPGVPVPSRALVVLATRRVMPLAASTRLLDALIAWRDAEA